MARLITYKCDFCGYTNGLNDRLCFGHPPDGWITLSLPSIEKGEIITHEEFIACGFACAEMLLTMRRNLVANPKGD